ncbi:MAG: hypothetical protein ACRERD_08450 [Candidatus Binatia bacterium]
MSFCERNEGSLNNGIGGFAVRQLTEESIGVSRTVVLTVVKLVMSTGVLFRRHLTEPFCLGAPLARMEGKIAFETLFIRLQTIRLAEGKNDFSHTPSFILRGLKALHLEFDPA